MAHFKKLVFVLCIAVAYGASVGPMGYDDSELQTYSYQKQNDLRNSGEDIIHTFDNEGFMPYRVSLAESADNFAPGRVISNIARTALNIFRTISEENVKNLTKLVTSLIEPYLGRQTQVILPLLTGIASVVLRSLVEDH